MTSLCLLNKVECIDEDKMVQIYCRYNKLMRFEAFDILHDYYLAEDAVQNAFISIMNYSQKINDVACPQTKSLIVIITRSASINIYRKRKEVNMQRAIIDEDIAEENVTENRVMQKLEAENLVEAIGSLASMYSNVLLLAYFRELPTKEIADLCSITVETVKKRLQRSRQLLRKELERGEY